MSNQPNSEPKSETKLIGLEYDVRKEQLVPIFTNLPTGKEIGRPMKFGPWTAISGTGEYRGDPSNAHIKAIDASHPVNKSGYFKHNGYEFTNVKSFSDLLAEIKKRNTDKKTAIPSDKAGEIRREFFRQFPQLAGGPIPGGVYEVSTQLATGNSKVKSLGFEIIPVGYTNSWEKRTSLRIHSTKGGSEDTTSQGCIALPLTEFNILSEHMRVLSTKLTYKISLRVNGGWIELPA